MSRQRHRQLDTALSGAADAALEDEALGEVELETLRVRGETTERDVAVRP
jgi:hypothetical protein